MSDSYPAALWKRILNAKDYMFQHDVLCCRTLVHPFHRMLQNNDTYRYYSELLLGPDDDLWRKLGIPFVESTWRDGSLDLTTYQHVSDKLRVQTYGSMFGTYEGRTPVIVICDFEKIKQVLGNYDCFDHRRVYLCGHELFDNMLPMTKGEKYKRIKSTIHKPLSYKAGINTRVDLMVVCADIVVRQVLDIADGDGIVQDGRSTFGVYSMDVITRLIYGKPIDDFENPDNSFAQNAIQLLLEGRDDILLNTVRYPEFRRRPQDCPFHPEAIEYFRRYVKQAVTQRKSDLALGLKFNDMLQDLVQAHMKNVISLNELYAQVIVLTSLAYHSISFTVAVACFEVSQNKDIQERLQEDIDGAILNNGDINNAALDDMKYLGKVLNEAMRKYPAAVRIERVCNKAATVGTIEVPEGMVIAIPIYALHNDPELYHDPDYFNPDRFNTTPPFYSFLPFGERQRKCIAYTFAMREMKVLMASLLSKVTLLPPEDPRPLVLSSKKNVLLAEEISFGVERRQIE